MGIAGLVFALFTLGYILGVWTACFVFRQPQQAYEDGDPNAQARPGRDLLVAPAPSTPVVALHDLSHAWMRRP